MIRVESSRMAGPCQASRSRRSGTTGPNLAGDGEPCLVPCGHTAGEHPHRSEAARRRGAMPTATSSSRSRLPSHPPSPSLPPSSSWRPARRASPAERSSSRASPCACPPFPDSNPASARSSSPDSLASSPYPSAPTMPSPRQRPPMRARDSRDHSPPPDFAVLETSGGIRCVERIARERVIVCATPRATFTPIVRRDDGDRGAVTPRKFSILGVDGA